MSELERVANSVLDSKTYMWLFGAEGTTDERQITKMYRNLAKILHPDNNGNDPLATRAFQHLSKLYEQATLAFKNGVYGKPVAFATVRSKRGIHEFLYELFQGDLCTVYSGASSLDGAPPQETIIKVVKRPGDKDLLI